MRKAAPLLALMLLLSLSGCGAPKDTAQPRGSGSEENVTAPEKSPLAESEETAAQDGSTTRNEEETNMNIQVTNGDIVITYELNDSGAARSLCAQLPLTLQVEPFSSNEMTFYPPEKLSTADTPLSGGAPGSLSYYKPWGDVVMFYASCAPNGSLYELGTCVSGQEDISSLSGTIEISAAE